MQLLPIILVLAVLVAFYFVGVYNKLAKLVVRIDEAWSQIDVQLKRRIDLIPNLVETVKGYASHEKEVFQKVTEARSALMNAGTVDEKGQADQMLTGALKSLFAVAEAYPELKAQEGFINLQKEISDTEDKVAYSRQFYNSIVRDFNSMLAVFPTNLVGQMFGYKTKPFFEANEEERKSVKVDFGQQN
ncbi:MAG TPA: LemA family protein [candidate division WWE3 bacterium]|uniref:LemA family protein n=1 Tax=candidate division WWE3 bacterium TaxID=2053526 RepID=A0A7C1HYR8_UNCKA|nr:LemA family protein [candidate division WWE3 bacterium]